MNPVKFPTKTNGLLFNITTIKQNGIVFSVKTCTMLKIEVPCWSEDQQFPSFGCESQIKMPLEASYHTNLLLLYKRLMKFTGWE